MSKITQVSIMLGAGAILIGIGSFITPAQEADIIMSEFNFEIEEIEIKATSTKFYYTTLKHNATTSEYEIVREEGTITIDNVGYLMCLDGVWETGTTTWTGIGEEATSTYRAYNKQEQQEFCEEEQKIQLQLNKKWFLESELGRLEMLKYTQ